ncbi:MAG TPA: phosphoribosylanthranilate isomerase [Terriglobales bacterium]|nr:phosphoribosylanthranilate isomerase [Terriglobales bacterium]
MTWIKICGITNLEDAQVAVDAGADAVGFVFYDKSPRYIAANEVAEIEQALPKKIERVGVFVRPREEDFVNNVRTARLNAVQWHLPVNETSLDSPVTIAGVTKRFRLYLSLPVTFFLESEDRWRNLVTTFQSAARNGTNLPFHTIFLDSGTAQQPGGTGKTFDWYRAAPLVEAMQRTMKVVIAGGLTDENVTEAIHLLHPWGVDVSSGVEATPGKKDPQKVREFVQAVRQTECHK